MQGRVHYTREATALALAQLRKDRASVWTPTCDTLLKDLQSVQTFRNKDPTPFPIIVLEGLDGVGKTTVASALAAKVGAVNFRTPPEYLEALRAVFRHLPEPEPRAFYCAANYIAAPHLVQAAKYSPVILDRWFCSTCAMGYAAGCTDIASLPKELFRWPEDLPPMSVGILLEADEATRHARVSKRGQETIDEITLAANRKFRECAMQSFGRFVDNNLLELVLAPNFKSAVNDILLKLKANHR